MNVGHGFFSLQYVILMLKRKIAVFIIANRSVTVTLARMFQLVSEIDQKYCRKENANRVLRLFPLLSLFR